MSTSNTKRALLEHARELVQHVGVNAMSYNDLSKKIGIRKASIHYHFPKKDDLIIELQLSCQREYVAEYVSIAESSGSSVDKLHRLTQVFIDSLNEGKLCIMTMLNAEYETLSEEIKKQLDSNIQQTTDIYEKIFIKGVEERELDCEDTKSAAYSFLCFLMGAQLVARASGGEQAFRNASAEYIKSIIIK